MITLLKCEYMKTRRRYILLTALCIGAILIISLFRRNYSEDFLKLGRISLLYELPLLNTIFMSVISIIVSSRICDLEHKGSMLKVISQTVPKGKIYDCKFIYGFSLMFICVVMLWIFTVIGGYVKGFTDSFPFKYYSLYFLFTLMPTLAIYIFHHTLSLCFENQAVTFTAGIIGTFMGTFSILLPKIPIVGDLLIWGYYGTFQFVRLLGYTKETRYRYAYFEITDINWYTFIIMIIMCIVIYVIGRKIFINKEL